MPLGNADEQKEAKPGTVEAWAVRPTTQSVAGTDCARDTAASLETTFHRCWSTWAWPRLRMSRGNKQNEGPLMDAGSYGVSRKIRAPAAANLGIDYL